VNGVPSRFFPTSTTDEVGVNDEAVRQQFEVTTTQQLKLAVDAIGEHPEVTDIYIYMSMEQGWGISITLYRANGKLVEPYNLDDVLKQKVKSKKAGFQDGVVDGVNAAYEDLLAVYRATGVEIPTRIVVHDDIAAEAVDADFSYRPLGPDSFLPQRNYRRWLANAEATGDMSADATTVDEEKRA
jgi:hypothetical protein